MRVKDYENKAYHFLEEGTTYETLFTGFSAEVGEVMSERVKETRTGNLQCDEVFVDELSDVLWYITMIARSRGHSLKDLMKHGINKLEHRAIHGKHVNKAPK
jgi:NTP pyrophosphatase (non-canonical NTP hydrolase)